MMPTSENIETSNRQSESERSVVARKSVSRTVYLPENPLRDPVRLFREIASDVVQSRGLVWQLFARNLRSMHRQTVLGLFWVFLPPIAATAVWLFLKSQTGFQVDVGVSYLAFVMTGMVLWQGCADAFQAPLNSVKSNRALLTRVNLPRESVLMVGLLEAAFHMSIRLIILVPVFFFANIPLMPTQLAALLAIPLLLMLCAGMGMVVAPFGSLYHDVGKFIAIALPFWMICTPIIYPAPASIPASLTVYANPIGGPLVVIRDWCLGIETAPVVFGLGVLVLALAVPFFFAGLIVYRVSMPFVVERM